jgi:surfeit locus 1 family protein
LRDPQARRPGQIAGETAVVGLVRQPAPQGLFTPDNEPARNRWFWRDLRSMVAAIYPGQSLDIAPFFVEAEPRDVPGGWPKGGQTNLTLPNSHLQYALTWFCMAAALALGYLAYAWSQFRPREDG